jgi:hypothetical protein
MTVKRRLLLVFLSVWCTGPVAWGQQPAYKPAYEAPTPLTNGDTGPTTEPSPPTPGVLSDWIVYQRDCCEGRQGLTTPLYTEIYLRAGPTAPIGNATLSKELQTGWSITAGARFLLFNEPLTSAWVVDVHVINTNQTGIQNGTAFPLTIFHAQTRTDFGKNGVPGLTIRDSNRTLAGLGLGREWYLWQPANTDGRVWRVGADFGGRYGSQNLSFNETRHITDVIGSMYAAVHTDLEFPFRYGSIFTGIRLEWDYTWSDILDRTSDVQDLSLFLTVGARY